MPSVASDFCRDMHHDLVQRDLLPVSRPVAQIIWPPTIQCHRPRVGCAHDGHAHG
jgi:hypothetical protein